MKVKKSRTFHLTKIPWLDRKMIRKRIKELKQIYCLAQYPYGHLHKLNGSLCGMYSIRLGKKSRLILCPIRFDITQAIQDGKPHFLKKYVIGVELYYTPNHYGKIY